MTNEEIIQEIKSGWNVQSNMYLLYLQNMPLLKQWSKQYNELLGNEDVRQECYIALHNAVKTFEIEKGYKFTTYLQSTVKTHFSRISNKYSNTDISPNDKRLLMQYNTLNEKELQAAGCNISIGKAANLLHCSEKDIQRILTYLSLHHCISTNAPIKSSKGENTSINDMLQSDINTVLEYEEKETAEHSSELWNLIHQSLDNNTFNVISLRFKENKTFKQTADALNQTLSSVRTSEMKALKKLRQNKTLKQYAEDYYNIYETSYHYGFSAFKNNQQSAVEYSVELIERLQKRLY